MTDPVPIVAVHGGAGFVEPGRLPEHIAGCVAAAAAGFAVLADGGSALDAAVRAVEVLEDDPCFNAGRGSSLSNEETIELDASVMEGTHLGTGAVAALPPFAHPVRIARAVMDEGRHVLYAGEGAARFARAAGFEPVGATELITDRARARLAAWRRGQVEANWAGGTVGAVSRDRDGGLAAATSTGGTVGKARGRVGDTPIVGAGTYAEDNLGACSATGIGEAILRAGLARRAVEACGDSDADHAAHRTLEVFTQRFGGRGGFILLDRNGRVGIVKNTRTMTHAVARADAPPHGNY
jgi:beta-aspartyl-peptidase (threonine type)